WRNLGAKDQLQESEVIIFSFLKLISTFAIRGGLVRSEKQTICFIKRIPDSYVTKLIGCR
ncbi:MAG: hypothetical protein AAF847_12950, partial [Bacteroidota bacterium]